MSRPATVLGGLRRERRTLWHHPSRNLPAQVGERHPRSVQRRPPANKRGWKPDPNVPTLPCAGLTAWSSLAESELYRPAGLVALRNVRNANCVIVHFAYVKPCYHIRTGYFIRKTARSSILARTCFLRRNIRDNSPRSDSQSN